MDAIDGALSGITRGLAGASSRARREALQRGEGGLRKYGSHCEPVLADMDRHRRVTFGHGYQKERMARIWGDSTRADVTLLLIGGGCQADLIQDLSHRELWPNVLGGPSVEVLSLELAKQVLGPDALEHPFGTMAGFDRQAHLLIIAEGLANKIVDIPEFGVTRGELIKPRQRRPIPPELWWATGRDDTWEQSC
jgi:hypothetical protein